MDKLNVLIAAKELYLSGHSKSMCRCVYDASGGDIRTLKMLSYYEACTMFCASGRDKYKWWWKPSDSESRIKYFDYLIEKYRENESN